MAISTKPTYPVYIAVATMAESTALIQAELQYTKVPPGISARRRLDLWMLPSTLVWLPMMRAMPGRPTATKSMVLIHKPILIPTPTGHQSSITHTRHNLLEATAAPAASARSRSLTYQHRNTHPSDTSRHPLLSVFPKGIRTDK